MTICILRYLNLHLDNPTEKNNEILPRFDLKQNVIFPNMSS